MKAVTYQIYSHDPSNYGTVSINPTIPWNTHKVEYKVVNVNTFANFLVTTKDDYIIFTIKNQTANKIITYGSEVFRDRSEYNIEEIPELLNKNGNSNITVSLTEYNTLMFRYSEVVNWEITDASHIVKLLLGLYNMSFPITSSTNRSSNIIEAASSPMLNYGNLLYLESLQGASLGMTLDNKSYHTPCIYRINSFLKPGIPVINNKKGDKIIVNAEAAKTISMQLVDFMYEPIILKSPLFVTLKIKMIPNECY